MALHLYSLNRDSVSLWVKQKEKKRFQNSGNIMPLKDLTQPSSANCTGTWIPITQTVQHDEKRSVGQSEKK